jgi:hypothetical protein
LECKITSDCKQILKIHFKKWQKIKPSRFQLLIGFRDGYCDANYIKHCKRIKHSRYHNVSSSKVDDLINNGKVEKSMFYNKSQAEIFLSETSKKKRKQQNCQMFSEIE